MARPTGQTMLTGLKIKWLVSLSSSKSNFMRKIISFMHISLDGFVAGPNGEMDWIRHSAELFEYVGERIKGADTAMYGRVTYDMMESYWPTAGDQPNASRHNVEHSKWYK